MDNFSIDDVRAFFTQDMENFLRQIDEAARAIGSSQRIAKKLSLTQRKGAAYFDVVADSADGLSAADGDSASNPLNAVFHSIADLARGAHGRSRGLEAALQQTRSVASFFQQVVLDLRAILDRELKRDANGAKELADELLAKFAPWREILERGKSSSRRRVDEDPASTGASAFPSSLAAAHEPFHYAVPYRGVLDRIEAASKQVVERLKTFERDPLRPSAEVTWFESISDWGHAMAGSCSLVGLASLAECARSVEYLAAGAALEMRRTADDAAHALAAAAGIGRACSSIRRVHHALDEKRDEDAVEFSLAMIAELTVVLDALNAPQASAIEVSSTSAASAPKEGDGADATLTDGADAQMTDGADAQMTDGADAPMTFDLAEVEAPLPAASDAGVSDSPVESPEASNASRVDAPNESPLESIDFGLDESEPMATTPEPVFATDGGMDAELLEIFREEARQAVLPLQGYLATLRSDRARVDVVRNLEKLFHTLKGSSATVGLTDISSMSAALEDRFENVLDRVASGENPIDDEFVARMVDETNRLLAASGLEPIRFVGAEPSQMSEFSDLRAIFAQEARSICDELDQQLARVPAASRSARREIGGALGRLFHKLKGSAVVNDAERIAKLAAEAQEFCEEHDLDDAVVQRCRTATDELRVALAALGAEPAEASVVSASVAEGSEVGSLSRSAHSVGETRVFERVREPVTVEADAVWEAFEVESQEALDALDRDVVALESSDQPRDLIQALFRNYHTLKGAANTVGLAPIGRVLHRVEDFLEELGEASVLPPLRNISRFLLKVQEGLRENLRQAPRGYVETDLARIEHELQAIHSGRAPSSRQTSDDSVASVSASAAEVSTGKTRGSKKSGTTTTSATPGRDRKYVRVPAERLEGLMNLTGELVLNRARLIRRVSMMKSLQRELMSNRLRLLSAVDSFREQYEFSTLAQNKQRAAHRAHTRELVGASASNSAPARARTTGSNSNSGGSNYDELFSDLELDRYEDVNILSRTLSEITSDISEVQQQINNVLDLLNEDSDQFSGNVSDLQNEIMRARMIPLDQLFIRIHGPVRDAAEREGKDVRVATFGEDVTLDKTIIDELYVPLLHLVRNSVSHGIETAEVRRRRGKSPQGTVELRARQESGQIVLEVTDDGGGLDLAAIQRRGLAMGLIGADVPLDSPLVKDLVFAPGLSVRESADDVAGRGVGCDVVRREIERLSGQIEVESKPGVGTTFRIVLPLTLAIYRALVVEQQGRKFALPLNFSERILELDAGQVVESAGSARVRYGDDFVPLEDLASSLELADTGGTAMTGGGAVLVRMGDTRVAMRVDRILGQDEIVVKSMGDLLADHPVFSGVTISGDGELILIVDVPGLLQLHKRRSRGAETGPSAGGASKLANVEARSPLAPEQKRTLRVLYVDDSLSVRKAAEKLLKNLGVEVTLAVDGVDGVDKVRNGRFDLIFTDLEMPRLNGYDMIRELRYVPSFKDIPVVVVTSRSGEKHRNQAAVVGATDYVTKPFSQEILEQKLVKWAGLEARTQPN